MKRYIYIIMSILSAVCFTAPAAQAADENDCTVQATITETRAGRNWQLNVELLNPGTTNLTAFQMDLLLPEGVALAEGTLRPGDRTLGHTLMANALPDGALRVVGYSSTNQAITGNAGVIFSLTLNADVPLAVGTYNVIFDNIRLSLRTGIEVPASSFQAALTASEPSVEPATHTLTFLVDGATYATLSFAEGAAITLPEPPTKEGYTFTGWDNLPETMPARDVTVNAVFTVNKYKVNYYLDGALYTSQEVAYGAAITLPEPPTKEGYTFTGWDNLPETMPAEDVAVSAVFTVNKYKVYYYLGDELYATQEVAYGAAITPPEVEDSDEYQFLGWQDVPATMPAHDISIYGTMKSTSIAAVRGEGSSSQREVYTLSGIRLSSSGSLPRGVYIVDGKRVLVK